MRRAPLPRPGLALAVLAGVLLAGAGGCGLLLPDVQVAVNVLDQRTQLENQVRGTYDELSQDLLMVASVRGIDPSGEIVSPPDVSPSKEAALRAMQSRTFNQDDVDELMGNGCAGEGASGELVLRPCDATAADPRYRAFVEAIVGEENRDRLVLMQRVIETNADMGTDDLDEVRRIFADLHREKAARGWWIESAGGWTRKGGGA